MIKIFFTIIIISFSITTFSQDLDSLLNSTVKEATTYTTATFKSTRILNGQSIERMKTKQLDVRIHHRFGEMSSGAYQFWGLDQSNIFLGLDYGITDWLMVGAGRSTFEKTINGFTKLSLLRQSNGEKNMPISFSLYMGCDANGLKWEHPERTNYFSSRMSYVFQGLIARKVNDRLSLQLSPTFIHKNMIPTAIESNDNFSIGVGGRIKLTKRMSFNWEYFYSIHAPFQGATYNPNSLSFGIDIETGGHVFQLMLTNSQNMTERTFINETTGHWLKNEVRIGFNISRVFSFQKQD